MKISTAALLTSCLFLGGCAGGGLKKSNIDYNKQVYQRSSSDAIGNKCDPSAKMHKMQWRDLVNMGSTCLANKKLATTEKIARELQSRDVTNPWGLFFLSEVAFQQGQTEKAKWYVSKGLSFRKDTGLLIYQMGRIEWTEGNKEEAVELVKDAVDEMPSLVEGHRFLAKIYHADLNFKSAASHYSKVVRLRPNDQEAWKGLDICRDNGVNISDTKRSVASREGGMK